MFATKEVYEYVSEYVCLRVVNKLHSLRPSKVSFSPLSRKYLFEPNKTNTPPGLASFSIIGGLDLGLADWTCAWT